jgi:hypothetical protein
VPYKRASNLYVFESGKLVKVATTAGTLLILLSILGFSWGGFNFTPERKNAGSVLVKHTSTLPIPPIIKYGFVDRRNWSSRDRNALQNGLMCSAFKGIHTT